MHDALDAPPTEPRGSLAARIALTVAGAAAPALITLALIGLLLHHSVHDFVPHLWNDQVAYWHKVASFARASFDTGYYSPNEVLPISKIAAIRYGTNGPWIALAFGPVAKLTGWHTWTPVLFNMALLAIAFVVFVLLVRPSARVIAAAGALLATTWPVIFYIPTSSQETLHQAFAVVLAALFVRALARGGEVSRAERVLGTAFVLLMVVFRFSWAPLLAMLLLFQRPRITRRTVVIAVVAGLVLAVVSLEITGALQPAGRNSVATTFTRIAQNPPKGTWQFVKTTGQNSIGLLSPWEKPSELSDYLGRRDIGVAGLQGWVIVLLAQAALLGIALTVARTDFGQVYARVLTLREWVFHSVNLGLVTALALCLYLAAGYYRVLGAHLLLSSLVVAGRARMRIVTVLLAANAVMFPVFIANYRAWSHDFDRNPAVVARDRSTFSQLMHYIPHAPTPWCNTILVPLTEYDWRVTLIPPGFGVADTSTYPARVKSRYALVAKKDAKRTAAAVRNTPLRPLAQTPVGELYVNPTVHCGRRS